MIPASRIVRREDGSLGLERALLDQYNCRGDSHLKLHDRRYRLVSDQYCYYAPYGDCLACGERFHPLDAFWTASADACRHFRPSRSIDDINCYCVSEHGLPNVFRCKYCTGIQTDAFQCVDCKREVSHCLLAKIE